MMQKKPSYHNIYYTSIQYTRRISQLINTFRTPQKLTTLLMLSFAKKILRSRIIRFSIKKSLILRIEMFVINNSIFFDEEYYNWILTENNMNEIPVHHFCKNWHHLNFDPSYYFSIKQYIDANPDLRCIAVNPLIHYELYGQYESRQYPILFRPSLFDDGPSYNFDNSKNIFWLSESIPLYDRDAGGYRIYQILRILCELGYNVTFAYFNEPIGIPPYAIELYENKIISIGVQQIIIGYKDIENFISMSGSKINCYFSSYAEPTSSVIKMLQKYQILVPLIYDTVDLHHMRLKSEYDITSDPQLLPEVERIRLIEITNIGFSATTLVVSNDELELVKNYNKDAVVEVIPLSYEILENKSDQIENRDGLLFIGNFSHKPNLDGLIWFMEDIWKLLIKKNIHIKLNIVGANLPEHIKTKYSLPDIVWHGGVHDLTKFLQSSRIFVSPLRFGAGIKGKNVQALSAGLPLLTTPVGAEGLCLTNEVNAIICNTASEFADSIDKLIHDDDYWYKLSDNGIVHAKENFNLEVIKERIKGILEINIIEN